MTDTRSLLSVPTWHALADEYLTGTEPGPSRWFDLLDVIYPQIELVNTLGEIDVQVGTYSWVARRDADQVITSYDELESWPYYAPRPLSDRNHNHPWFTRNDNLAFRAWHDTAHLDHGLSFTANDELLLYGHQAQGLRSGARDALFCESVYQLSAAVTQDGYPDVQACVAIGPVGAAVRDLLIGLTSLRTISG